MSWAKRIFVVLFLAALGGMVAVSLKPRGEPPTSVQSASVKRDAITRKVTAAGKLQPATQVKVSSNLSGDLLELHIKEGDLVKKGQLLARIESRRYAAQVAQQEAVRASAQAELAAEVVNLQRLVSERDRVKRLAQSNSASPAELERAESDVAAETARQQSVKERIAQADGALSEAKHFLSQTTLYAPIDGVVTSRLKQVGERVRGSDFTEDVILVISTLSSMEVKVEVGEHEVVYLHEGDPADVEVDAFPDRKWPAAVVEIAQNATIKNPGTDAEVTSFPVRLALTAPVPGGLPGMSSEVAVRTETHDKALVIPIQAVTVRTERELKPGGSAPVFQEGGATLKTGTQKKPREALQKVVFVVENGVAKARRVETGLASESEIEIVEGLKEGEVVVEGPYRTVARELSDGKPVKIENKGDKADDKGEKKEDGKEKPAAQANKDAEKRGS
jgi:HlyD family secretion protein